MTRILFLDDRRSRWERFSRRYPAARWVRSVPEFAAALPKGWESIWLDHDLNDETHAGVRVDDRARNNGVEACRLLIQSLTLLPALREVVVHSTNKVGAASMAQVLRAASVDHRVDPFDRIAWDLPGSTDAQGVYLHLMPHGLGDVVQLTAVLRNVPGVHDVSCGVGKETALLGVARNVFTSTPVNRSGYTRVIRHHWQEARDCRRDEPGTKAASCLREVFGVRPRWEDMRYTCLVRDESLGRVRNLLAALMPFAVLHYEGNTSPDAKNLTHQQAAEICAFLNAQGLTVILLDWDHRSPLPNGRGVVNFPAGHPIWLCHGTGDAESIAAVMMLSRLNIVIDSGPGKIACAVGTPSITCWTRLHPYHFCDHSDTVHVVPRDHADYLYGDRDAGVSFFQSHYRHEFYSSGRLVNAVLRQAARLLNVEPALALSGGLVQMGDFMVRADNLEQDMVIVRDVHEQDCYRTCLLGRFAEDEVIVDVGAHIGAFAKLWHARNPKARIVCIEACPENLECLRANVGEFATVIHGACTYEPGELALLNAVRPDCESTGGSTVVPADRLDDRSLHQQGYEYWHDRRPLPKVTLEDVMARLGVDHIDLLKLDCEGSEFSILEKSPSLTRVHFILGEYHGRARWDDMRQRLFRGWDYGHMSADPTGLGNFHLCNPVWPPAPLPGIAGKIRPHIMPGDGEAFEPCVGYYQLLYDLVRREQPRSVVEVGVRAGYSGLVIAEAAPEACVTGIESDSEPASRGSWKHAEKVLAGRTYRLLLTNSHTMKRLPAADLVVIDGDHSFAGTLADLRLSHDSAARTLIVDDHDRANDVGRAVAEFLAEQRVWSAEILATGIPNRGVAVLRRPPPKVLRLAVPGGIGDAFWVLLKVPELLARTGAVAVDLDVCSGPPYRSKEFLQGFDFVRAVRYVDHRLTGEDFTTPGGEYNYDPSQPGWRGCDWLLQANGHLECGRRIEDWLPDLETDWDVLNRFHWPRRSEDAVRSEAEQGPYCVFYAGPEAGNTVAGHNRGGLWSAADWVRLAELAEAVGLRVLLVGAEWDRSYLDRHLLPAGFRGQQRLGCWRIEETLAVIRQARFYVGYQSGLGIAASYLGVPTALFWRPYGDSILPDHRVTFREEMASAWVPQQHLASGRYLPCIYGRVTPEVILDHYRTVWEQLPCTLN